MELLQNKDEEQAPETILMFEQIISLKIFYGNVLGQISISMGNQVGNSCPNLKKVIGSGVANAA